MCSGSLTLAWQGQGNRGGGGRVEEQLPEERHLGFKLVAVQPGRVNRVVKRAVKSIAVNL